MRGRAIRRVLPVPVSFVPYAVKRSAGILPAFGAGGPPQTPTAGPPRATPGVMPGNLAAWRVRPQHERDGFECHCAGMQTLAEQDRGDSRVQELPDKEGKGYTHGEA